MKRFYLPLISLIILLFSCSDDEPQIVNITYEKLPLSKLCNVTSTEPTGKPEEKTYVINNQQDYNSLTSCQNNPPAVDFSKNFILAGRVIFSNCAVLKSESMQLENNMLKYKIDIEQQECQKLDTVYFMASVPIRYNTSKVSFDIHY